jgi:hypothetical protein
VKSFALGAVVVLNTMTGPATAVPFNDKIEGYWLYRDVKKILLSRGFEHEAVHKCLDTNSVIAVHCTADYWNSDGVRLSVAVRKSLQGDSAGRAYRIVCTAGCRSFSWGQLEAGRGRRDPLE